MLKVFNALKETKKGKIRLSKNIEGFSCGEMALKSPRNLMIFIFTTITKCMHKCAAWKTQDPQVRQALHIYVLTRHIVVFVR